MKAFIPYLFVPVLATQPAVASTGTKR